MTRKRNSLLVVTAALLSLALPAAAQKPDYEPAYVDGKVVTISTIFMNQLNAPPKAQAPFYLVVYPFQPVNWDVLGLAPPICDPCDHFGDGVDPLDFHDHVLDSMPGDPGHGTYRALRHLFLVLPAYNGETVHDLLVSVAYALHLPAMSSDAVGDLLADLLPDGSPIAMKIDTGLYIGCQVVNSHASK